jgi:hypothetical protein
VKSKVVISVLAVIGLVALSATAAQAAGGNPFVIPSFFVCQGINGEDPGRSVSVQGSILLVNPQGARLGNGSLVCSVARLVDAVTGASIPDPPLGVLSDGLKCYNVSVPRRSTTGINTRFDIIDYLFPVDPQSGLRIETNVPTSSFQYVCSPATFTNPH